jgi:hypothetical protein
VRQSQDNQEVKKMSPREVKMTTEEEALGEVVALNKEVLSEAARTLLDEASLAACKMHLAHSYSFCPAEYEEIMQKMCLEATRLTDRDREHLAKIVRAGKAAASSIDPDDETPAGYRYWRGDLHWYYEMISSMVDEVLQDARWVEVTRRLGLTE